jgi:peptide deformylase
VLGREGCLSLPHLTANVNRAEKITVKYVDKEGNEKRVDSSDYEARVIQHEMDHLDGLLFLDRVSSLKTDVFRRKRY